MLLQTQPFALALLLVLAAPAYLAALLAYNVLRARASPLSALPGPPRASLLRGSFPSAPEAESAPRIARWLAKYGPAIRLSGLKQTQRMVTVDLKAIQHVLGSGYLYHKPDHVRFLLGAGLGEGLLFAEGETHRRQRKVMNPAFGPAAVRAFTGTFVQKANELRDVWLDLAAQETRPDGWTALDAYVWLNKAALDIIGLTGFGYDFDALRADEDHPNELYEAIHGLVARPGLLTVIQMLIPGFRYLPTPAIRARRASLRIMRRIGLRLIEEKKAAVLQSAPPDGAVEKDDVRGRDLLSLLIKANLASDVPAHARMSDDEILAQVPTFLVAGHETTSTLVSWTLFALATAPTAQARLRRELRACECATDAPSFDQLNAFSYLDNVVRETLRLHAPVPTTVRIATRADVVPLQRPIHDALAAVPLAAGDIVSIPIEVLSRSSEIWGPDAAVFRPERWENPPPAAADIPGVLAGLPAFLAGPHACIGFRFALAEAKALLFALCRTFEFALAVEPGDVVCRVDVVGKPHLAGDTAAGPQLPMLVRAVRD
ncbi:cytochrome P450 [Vararia minispora EC-137]|uniref:Cytochrome P450 n=1 Tax=Vararia minispora EC-137 TaxID=1314806 RepID=A0ACB8Q6I0_9AGAM|nr:cytochrome P450 [Vararia minispora EC-137]